MAKDLASLHLLPLSSFQTTVAVGHSLHSMVGLILVATRTFGTRIVVLAGKVRIVGCLPTVYLPLPVTVSGGHSVGITAGESLRDIKIAKIVIAM